MTVKTPTWLAPKGPRWTAEPGERIADNPYFSVDQYRAVAPTGVKAQYFVQGFKRWAVGALPLHDDGSVTLVGQWRFPFGAYSWEIPEGGAPKGEDPLEGAKRELREEAGLEAALWRPILQMHLSNASSDEEAFGFLATGLTPAPVEPDATEDLAIVRVPFNEALDAAVSGAIRDSITVAMLLRVHHMAYREELEPAIVDAILRPTVR